MSNMTPEEQAAYDEAAARIAQAEREGWTELDLRSLDLTELPPEIGRLTGLRSLNLRQSANGRSRQPARTDPTSKPRPQHNQLTAVPDWLGELTQLQTSTSAAIS